jgi:hypothetical protein
MVPRYASQLIPFSTGKGSIGLESDFIAVLCFRRLISQQRKIVLANRAQSTNNQRVVRASSLNTSSAAAEFYLFKNVHGL